MTPTIEGGLIGGSIAAGLAMLSLLAWLPRRNASKIDCLERDVAKVYTHLATLTEKAANLEAGQKHLIGKMDRLLQANGLSKE